MRFSDVKPSVFAPRRGGRRGGFPKGAALKSAPENPKKRAKYSLSRREARPVLYGARAPRAPVFAAVRGKGPSGHPPAGVRGSGPAVTIGTLGGGWRSPGVGLFHFDFLPNFQENSKRVTVASKLVSRNVAGLLFIVSGQIYAITKPF